MRKAIENKTQMPMFVAGMMIPPGETRLIEDDMLPPEHREKAPIPAPEIPADPLVELLEQNAKTVVAALDGISSEDLARLQLLETEGKARKTVLEAIAAEGLKRAQVRLEGKGEEASPVTTQETTADSATPPAEKTEGETP